MIGEQKQYQSPFKQAHILHSSNTLGNLKLDLSQNHELDGEKNLQDSLLNNWLNENEKGEIRHL